MARMKINESETVEFKEQWTDTALESLAAFANHKGGKLYVGVRDDGEILGFSASDKDLQRMVSQIVSALLLRPSGVAWEKHAGKNVLRFEVEPTTAATPCRGRYLVRVGTTNHDMTPEQIGRRLMANLGESWDALPSRFGLEAIDPTAIRTFARLAKNRQPQIRENDAAAHVLSKLGLFRDGTVTKGALLLFGKEPQRDATAAQIHIGRFKGGITLDDRFIGGTLWNQLDSVLNTFRSYLQLRSEVKSTSPTLEGIQRHETWEFPLDALREATVNALIHRDYTVPGDIQIRVEDDRIHFGNPGRLPTGVTLPDLLKDPHPSSLRNPLLAQTFWYAEFFETWGSGTLRMGRLCREYGLPEPQFSETGGGFAVLFTKDLFTTERLQTMGLAEPHIKIIAHVKDRGRITNAEVQKLTGSSKPSATRYLDELVSRGILAKTGTRGRGVFYRLIGS